MEGGEYSPPPLPLLPPPPNIEGSQRRKKDKNNRRFSDEQIRSLESIFKLETKLEPRKKLQLARELGLQPRQVAIWFQNRRARWKTKQIEQEYRVLKANYDNLNSRYESLKKEKQSLLIQSQKLSDLLKKSHDEGRGSKDLEGNSTESEGLDHGVVMYSDDDYEKGNTGYPPHKEETELLNLGEQVVDGSLVPQEKWCGFECGGGVFDHTCGTSNWWEFWTQ